MPTLGRLPVPKYQQLYDALYQEIVTGRRQAGERLPSEAELVRSFGASRITVGRALRDLQREGLVDRRPGSGTYVRARPQASGTAALTFGLLAPDVERVAVLGEMCRALNGAASAGGHAMLWGAPVGTDVDVEASAWALCEQQIARRVAGVFFAPLEYTPSKDAVNRRIARAFDDAGIPVVLLDRPVEPYGRYEPHDVVGIDNRRAGFRITSHLLAAGATRVGFVGMADAAPTVDARLAGYREALHVRSAEVHPQLVFCFRSDADEEAFAFVNRSRPDALVCANDELAARMMRALLAAGLRIPQDVRLAGIDDAPFAAMLPVPLTTLRQPVREIGISAMTAMVDRLQRPDLPPRDIYLHTTLIVRASCGSRQ
jgi:DNA-binding LacI/PurR family transcriptional regulator